MTRPDNSWGPDEPEGDPREWQAPPEFGDSTMGTGTPQPAFRRVEPTDTQLPPWAERLVVFSRGAWAVAWRLALAAIVIVMTLAFLTGIVMGVFGG